MNIVEFMLIKKNLVGGNYYGYINVKGNFYFLYKVYVFKGLFFNVIL